MLRSSTNGYDFGSITSEIIGAAIEVHKNLGPGFQEVIYQRALAVELRNKGLEFIREAKIPVHYKGEKIGMRRVDFLLSSCLVEIKARSEIVDQDYVQTLSYLRASGYRVALLLNFGASRLGIKRFVNDQPTYHPEQHNRV